MPSPRFSRPGDTAVTERCATTFGRSVAPCPGRGKSWVLAMLAPKRGLRVAPVPPKTADLTRPARGRRNMGRSGRRNRHFDRTNEQPRTSWPCRYGYPSLTVGRPMVGETEHASHTEIRTLPRNEFLRKSKAILPAFQIANRHARVQTQDNPHQPVPKGPTVRCTLTANPITRLVTLSHSRFPQSAS
jgi:hypothetical protein